MSVRLKLDRESVMGNRGGLISRPGDGRDGQTREAGDQPDDHTRDIHHSPHRIGQKGSLTFPTNHHKLHGGVEAFEIDGPPEDLPRMHRPGLLEHLLVTTIGQDDDPPGILSLPQRSQNLQPALPGEA